MDTNDEYVTTKECLHENIYFGSGDFYIICSDCERFWRMETVYKDNVGGAAGLSGETRIKPIEE